LDIVFDLGNVHRRDILFKNQTVFLKVLCRAFLRFI
jgi:hypothetical protein